ncbi:hypothetical protein [Miniphocaeibacter massiliensis]|uniref:hypothetical protein n=1 Tax=Miniphocaeibacter massiliensis TaxID=2041841 RepID=UPI000C07EF62|nr:hypothetical protein [Miniphocaeibacter massiliensis]
MNYINDFINVQVMAIKNTFKRFRYIIIVAFVIIAGSLAINVVSNLLGGLMPTGSMSIVIGTAIYLLELFVLSIIMSVLTVSIKENTSLSSFISLNNTQIFYKLIQIGFIFYIANLALGLMGLSKIYIIVYPALLILFNATPETIYLENYDGIGTIIKSVEFLKNNIINWVIPNVVIFGVIYLLNINYILPFGMYFEKDIKSVLIVFGKIVVYSIFLIYRGNLFEILNGSSMRKREYMRKFK